jgi:hypothetical protein
MEMQHIHVIKKEKILKEVMQIQMSEEVPFYVKFYGKEYKLKHGLKGSNTWYFQQCDMRKYITKDGMILHKKEDYSTDFISSSITLDIVNGSVIEKYIPSYDNYTFNSILDQCYVSVNIEEFKINWVLIFIILISIYVTSYIAACLVYFLFKKYHT